MRALLLSLTLGALAATAGCFFLFTTSTCNNHENCPYPEQCINFAGYSPTAYADFAVECTGDADCGGVECYAGYCYMSALDPNGMGGACLAGNHMQCTSTTYCGLDGVCVLPSEAGVVERGTDTGIDAEYLVEDATSLAQLNGVDVVAGHLMIGVDYNASETWSVNEDELVFPDLQIVTGNLVIKNQLTAERVSFPNLHTIGGELEIGTNEDEANTRLRTVDFPALQRVGANTGAFLLSGVDISENPLLSEVNLPLLEGALFIDLALGEGNGADTLNDAIVNAPSLTLGGGRLYFDFKDLPVQTFNVEPPVNNIALWFLDVNADLSSAVDGVATVDKDLWITGGSATTSLSFDALNDVSELTIERTTVLSTISVPVLATLPTLEIEDNADLTSLSMPSLSSCQSLTVSGNPMLDVCLVKTIVDAAGTPPASVDADGNQGDYDACP